jgi:hypothetical protein
MTNIPTGDAWRPYLRVLGETSLDVVSVGVWIAAAELPPLRRRLARAGLTALTAATAIPAFRAARSTTASVPESATFIGDLPFVDAGIRLPTDEEADRGGSRRRTVLVAALLTTVAAGSVGVAVASHRLERRWLARLVRRGHPHPHRGLALRMAGLTAATLLPTRLLALRERDATTPH